MAKTWMDRAAQNKGGQHLSIDMKSGKVGPLRKPARAKPAKAGKKK